MIDHSVQVDVFGTRDAFRINAEQRVRAQRGALRVPALGPGRVRGLQGRAAGHRHRAPGQPRVPRARGVRRTTGTLYPDTLVGTDSHTTMINGLGVLGWGVGGIEAEAAMLGQPMSMLIPRVVGFKLDGELPEGATATDLVLTVTQMLREHGVVGKFVEFYGPGVPNLPLADRATIGNMSPEFGSTCAIFPIDAETLRYLEFSGRAEGADRARRGLRARAGPVARRELRGADLLRDARARPRRRRAVAGRPEAPAGPRVADRVQGVVPDGARRASCPSSDDVRRGGRGVASRPPTRRRTTRRTASGTSRVRATPAPAPAACRSPTAHRSSAQVTLADGTETELDHGHVVIAAITSCTNTSNPSVMLGAGLLAKNAVERGLQVEAVGEDVARARLEGRHRVLRARRA